MKTVMSLIKTFIIPTSLMNTLKTLNYITKSPIL